MMGVSVSVSTKGRFPTIIFILITYASVVSGYPSPRRERFTGTGEYFEPSHNSLAAFFISLTVILGICVALIIGICVCCRFDNYFADLSKLIRARWRAYKQLPDDPSSNDPSSLNASQENRGLTASQSGPSDGAALKYTAHQLADHLRLTGHPQPEPTLDAPQAKTASQQIKVEEAEEKNGVVGHSVEENMTNEDGNRPSEVPESEEDRTVSTEKVSTNRRRPPLLKQLNSEASIVSMGEYQEDSVDHALAAREFFFDPRSFDSLASMSENDLDAYRVYFSVDEWAGIKRRWELACDISACMDTTDSDATAPSEMTWSDHGGTDTDEYYQPKRVVAAKNSNLYKAALRTFTSFDFESHSESQTSSLCGSESEDGGIGDETFDGTKRSDTVSE